MKLAKITMSNSGWNLLEETKNENKQITLSSSKKLRKTVRTNSLSDQEPLWTLSDEDNECL
jgi:hypothetical protein